MRSNRAEFSHIGPNEDRSISTIVVEHIPHEKYNEESVREFFGQFGKIEEVTLRHTRATSNLALVKFDTYDAARAAWASPKVIFDNRFVKVYWFKPRTAEGEQQDMAEQGQRESKPSSESPAPLPFDYEEFQKQQAKAQKIHEERKRNKEEVEGARSDLERMKEDLARKQAEAKAKLMEKIEKSSHAGGAGTEGGGGASQAPTKDAQGDSSKAQSQTQPSDPAPGTTQNENETNVSEKTKALREQLAALEAEAHSFGLDTCPSTSEYDYYPPYRGRGSYRGSFSYRGRGARGAYDPSRGRGGFGRGRGGFIRGRGGAMTLDNRPKRVLVTPVRSEDEEAFKLYLIVSFLSSLAKPNYSYLFFLLPTYLQPSRGIDVLTIYIKKQKKNEQTVYWRIHIHRPLQDRLGRRHRNLQRTLRCRETHVRTTRYPLGRHRRAVLGHRARATARAAVICTHAHWHRVHGTIPQRVRDGNGGSP